MKKPHIQLRWSSLDWSITMWRASIVRNGVVWVGQDRSPSSALARLQDRYLSYTPHKVLDKPIIQE